MKLSVVILNYNVRYFLELCLQSVYAALEGISSEIIVVDNDSIDNSSAMIRATFPDVILIENSNNVGFSKANNQAVKRANGEFVCILNPDTVVAEDTFKKLLRFADSIPNLGIVGCRMIDGSGKFLPESKRNIPTIRIAFQKLMGFSSSYYASNMNNNNSGEVDVLTGAFMLMQRSLYNKLQGFDEDFFMYGEDIDLCYRAQKMGCKNYYYSDATIIHFKGESTLKDITYFKRFYGAMQLFHDKHFESNNLIGLAVRLISKLMPHILPKGDLQKTILPNPKAIAILKPHSKPMWLSPTEVLSISNQNEIKLNKKTDLIMDASKQTFKEIIHQIDGSNLPHVFFKIWPQNTTYCVGSDFSNRRGEVVHFDDLKCRAYF